MADKEINDYRKQFNIMSNRIDKLGEENRRKLDEIINNVDKEMGRRCEQLMYAYLDACNKIENETLEIAEKMKADFEQQENKYRRSFEDKENECKKVEQELLLYRDTISKENLKLQEEAEIEVGKADALLTKYETVIYEGDEDNILKFILGYLYPEIKESYYKYVRDMHEVFGRKLYQSVIGMGHQIHFISEVKEKELQCVLRITKEYVQKLICELRILRKCIEQGFRDANLLCKYEEFNKHNNLTPDNIYKEVIDYWTYNDYSKYEAKLVDVERYVYNYGDIDENTDIKDFTLQICRHINNPNRELISNINSGCASIYERYLNVQKDNRELEYVINRYYEEVKSFDERLCYEKILITALNEYQYCLVNKAFVKDESEIIDKRIGTSLLFVSPENIAVEVCIIKTYIEKDKAYSNQVVVALSIDELGSLYNSYKSDIISLISSEPGINTNCIFIDFDLDMVDRKRHDNMTKMIYNFLNVRR